MIWKSIEISYCTYVFYFFEVLFSVNDLDLHLHFGWPASGSVLIYENYEFDWLLTKFGRGRAAESFKLDLVEVLDKMLRLGTYGRWSLSGILIGWMNMLWSRTTLSGLCLGFGMLMHIWSNKDKEVQSSFTLFWGKDVYNRNQQLQFWKGWTPLGWWY